jgi:hypothetical protein
MTAITQGAIFKVSSSDNNHSQADRPDQAAFVLDRRADAELSVGRFVIAERLAHEAAALRERAR